MHRGDSYYRVLKKDGFQRFKESSLLKEYIKKRYIDESKGGHGSPKIYEELIETY
ncbi:hypothetical protein ACQPU1_05990 [Clostridium paraputrificum]|uniref:hypothetical protein n=1 Tax=Clostridium paraputrificum TaxID=29363 RepID=UPI003D33E116